MILVCLLVSPNRSGTCIGRSVIRDTTFEGIFRDASPDPNNPPNVGDVASATPGLPDPPFAAEGRVPLLVAPAGVPPEPVALGSDIAEAVLMEKKNCIPR
mmetsp:Transcript_64198/g.74623  ORF Transcript_64198/g.74623 Transcript_64198/m.74623 type:complete len:100 (-) Transcript_64198:552-851(-)